MQYVKPKVYWLMLIGIIFSILNTSTSYAAPICPSGDKMYYVGANPPYGSTSLALSWTDGSTNKTFNFTDGTGTTMTINFPLLVDPNSNYGGTPPFYGNITYETQNALNLVHNSPAIKDNHTMTISVNRAVTKLSFVVQDLDSFLTPSYQVDYQQQVDVSSTSGQLTYNPYYHTINASNNIVTAIRGQNCSLNGCNIDATWGAKSANSIFSITHSNRYTQFNTYYRYHVVGYSDFYFCVTPPKLTTRKVLTGNRVETNDQFTIATTTGTTPVSSFTTTGTGSSLSSNSITAKGLSTTATYTIAETIANTDGKGDLAKYSTSYACTNASSSSTTTMPSGSTTSFNLPTLTYGDDITCTITNTPKAYTFSGIVFNDNGGLTLANDLSVPVGTNTTYFNGVYDSSVETGITQTGLTIELAKNCNTTTPTIIQSAIVGSDGTYSISATSTQMANATNVCLIQREPNGNLTSYPVDTTNNQANITFASTIYDYQNINFGEVSQNNAGLVLVKEQATNNCNISIATMLGLNYVKTQQDAIDARKCVAYKITAYNRTNLTNGLTDIKITDALPKKGVNGSTVNSLLDNPLDTTLTNFKVDTANSVAIGANGTVVSDVQSLAKGASRSLYFNTKYDANSK